MVRRILGFCALALNLSLSSCWLLSLPFASVFPVTATQTLARLDLSDRIPREAGKEFHFTGLEIGGRRIYVLSCGGDFGAGTANLYVLDGDLNVLDSKTLAELRGIHGDFGGSYSMADANGNLIVGNIRFNLTAAGSLSPLPAPDTTIPTRLENPCFSTASNNVTSLWVDKGAKELNYAVWAADWSGYTPYNPTVSLAADYELNDVLADPGTGDEGVMILRNMSGDDYSLVRISKLQVAAGLANDILGTYQSVSVPGSESGLFGFSSAGLVRYDNETKDFILFNYALPALETFHSPGVSTKVQSAYTMDGKYSYTFDYVARVVTKYATWWNRNK